MKERSFVCSSLPHRFLLHSSENDISSPPKELLFLVSSNLLSLLLFKLSLALRFLCQISPPPLWNFFVPLAPSRTLKIQSLTFVNIPTNKLCSFFRMLQNNQLERLPDDAPWDLPNLLSLWVAPIQIHTNTNSRLVYLFQLGLKLPLTPPSTHLYNIKYHMTYYRTSPPPAEIVLPSLPCRLTVGVTVSVSVQLMVASGSHEGNSRHCRPGRASPMSCETTPFSINSPALPPPLLSHHPHCCALANESFWWLNCLICGVSVCVCVCLCQRARRGGCAWTTSSVFLHPCPSLQTLYRTRTPHPCFSTLIILCKYP